VPPYIYICDSETGYCILSPFKLSDYGKIYDACFSSDEKHILVKFDSYTAVWDIEIGEEQF